MRHLAVHEVFLAFAAASLLACREYRPAPPAVGSALAPASLVTLALDTPAPLDAPVIGGTRQAWIRALGLPVATLAGERFADGSTVVWTSDVAGEQRAGWVVVAEEGPVFAPLVQQHLGALRPADAQVLRSYQTNPGRRVSVFWSRQLAQVVHPGLYDQERPGAFYQSTDQDPAAYNRLLLTIGDPPES